MEVDPDVVGQALEMLQDVQVTVDLVSPAVSLPQSRTERKSSSIQRRQTLEPPPSSPDSDSPRR